MDDPSPSSSSSPFSELSGTFEPLEEETESAQLSAPDVVPPLQRAIAEQTLRKNHWRLIFQRVQYGTYHSAPACLLVIDGRSHPEDRRRHRFTWASISVSFESDDEERAPVELVKLAPEGAYGITVPEVRSSHWAIKPKLSLSVPGAPVTVDLLDASVGAARKYTLDRTASMQGSERGFPLANEAVWTLEEANSEGIPWRIPPMVLLLKYHAGVPFRARFEIDAKVGFSVNPLRWGRIFANPAREVRFDGRTELVLEGEREVGMGREWGGLELGGLSSVDFSGDG